MPADNGPEISQQLTLDQTQAARLLLNVESLTKGMDEVKEVVNKLRHTVVDMNAKIVKLETDMNYFTRHNETVDRQMGQMSAKIQSLENEIDQLRRLPGERAQANQQKLILGLIGAVIAGVVGFFISRLTTGIPG